MYADAIFGTPLFDAGVFFMGLLIGSFLNVVIYRLPLRLEFEWQSQCAEMLELEGPASSAPPSIVRGRSFCPHCRRQITAFENIPLLSWLFLRGKCPGCKGAISKRYPIVELLTGLLFLLMAWRFGPSLACLAALVFVAYLVALSGIDFDHQLLPDSLTLQFLWLGLLVSLTGVFTSATDAIIGAAAGYLALWVVYHLFKLLTGKEGMGFGDFKLLAGLGAWMGWQSLPEIIFLSSVVGAVTGILLMTLRRRDRNIPIPFGPFLAIAGLISLVWGEDLSTAYFRMLGLN